MTPILTLFTSSVYLKPLTSWQGWVGWSVLLILTLGGVIRWRKLQRTGAGRGWLLILFLSLSALTNLFFGVRLSIGATLPEPGLPLGAHNPVIMIFSCLPWMLAGGFLGPVDALLVGLLTGLTRSLWDTHNIFSILEPALLAVLYSCAVRQRFCTLFYRAMRQPMLVGLGLVPLYALLFIASAFFSVSDTIPARLDFALTHVGPATLAVLGELAVAGLMAQVAAMAAANARLFRSAEVGRQRLAAILASTPDPVLVTDQENRVILANPAAMQILGFPIDSTEEQPAERVIGQKELRDLLEALGSGKQSAEVVLAEGKRYIATASAVLVDGRPAGGVCVLRDVTQFKELDVLKTDFVSTVSHDLRSPLTLMRGYATMLEMVGELNVQQKNYVEKIIVGVEGMSRLVSTLLDLGRIDAGVGLQVDKVPVRDIMDAVIANLHLQAEQKEIQLRVEAAPELPQFIEADRVLLEQAVYNLVENAIKYTPLKGSVTLRIKPHQSVLQFEVQDTGIGISSSDLPRLFEKFFRGSQREARAQGGSGLGLAIVRSIAERHGGKVWVESKPGKGSTFYLLIPFEQPERPQKK